MVDFTQVNFLPVCDQKRLLTTLQDIYSTLITNKVGHKDDVNVSLLNVSLRNLIQQASNDQEGG